MYRVEELSSSEQDVSISLDDEEADEKEEQRELFPQNPIERYILYFVITDDESIVPNKKLFTVINSLRLVTFGASCLSGVPFISIARQAVSNITLGYLLAGNVVFSFAIGSSWGWQNILKDLDPDEETLTGRIYIYRKRRVIIVPLSLISGALTSIPATYFAYIYNTNGHFWIIFNYIDALGLHSFGFSTVYNLLIDNVISLMRKKNMDKEQSKLLKHLSKAKQECEAIIKVFNTLLISDAKVYAGYQNLLATLNQEDFTASKKIALFFGFLINSCSTNEPAPPIFFKKGIPRFLLRFFGNLLMPTSNVTVNAILSYGAASLITTHFLLKLLLFVPLTTFTGAMIDYYTNDLTFRRFFDSLYYLFFQKYKPNLPESLYMKSYIFITTVLILSAIVTGLTALPSLSNELEKQLDSDSELILVFAILSLLGQSIAKIFMSHDLVFDLFSFFINRFAALETRKMQRHSEKLDRLFMIVSHSETDAFKKILDYSLQHEDIENTVAQQQVFKSLRKYSFYVKNKVKTDDVVHSEKNDIPQQLLVDEDNTKEPYCSCTLL